VTLKGGERVDVAASSIGAVTQDFPQPFLLAINR
jgi:hypothetical protein